MCVTTLQSFAMSILMMETELVSETTVSVLAMIWLIGWKVFSSVIVAVSFSHAFVSWNDLFLLLYYHGNLLLLLESHE
jgi:hypothetical protein